MSAREVAQVPEIRYLRKMVDGEMPGTLRRSCREAQETFTEALVNAIQTYGQGDDALRAAYTVLKRKFEKRGVARHQMCAHGARVRSSCSASRHAWRRLPPRRYAGAVTELAAEMGHGEGGAA